jgi:hypothetical protein
MVCKHCCNLKLEKTSQFETIDDSANQQEAIPTAYQHEDTGTGNNQLKETDSGTLSKK